MAVLVPSHLSISGTVLIVLGTALLYVVCLVFYRLFLSPIAHVPGPKLAAATSLYEFYFDVVKGGQFIWEIQKMHARYGPVVRVNPWEVHTTDLVAHENIYSTDPRRVRNLFDFTRRGLDAPFSLGGTVDHNVHRMRRDALNPFFSRRHVREVENSVIRPKISKLCERLRGAAAAGEVLTLDNVFMALTVDVIGKFCFDHEYEMLDRPDFGATWRSDLLVMLANSKLLNHCYFLVLLMKSLPESVVMKIAPAAVKDLLNYKKRIEAQVLEVLHSTDDDDGVGYSTRDSGEKGTTREEGHYKTIFHSLIDSDLPKHELELSRLTQEGQVLVAAGSETTAKTLVLIHYHLLSNPKMLHRLQEELATVPADAASMELEKLPYLTAVITEGLRHNLGITGRNQRILENETLQIGDVTLPRGNPISVMSLFIHTNETYFPDPWRFEPDRWLPAEQQLDPESKNKYPNADSAGLHARLVTFGHGVRACIAKNLAYAELYLTLNGTIRTLQQCGAELWETTADEIAFKHDWVVQSPGLGRKGVRVRLGRAK